MIVENSQPPQVDPPNVCKSEDVLSSVVNNHVIPIIPLLTVNNTEGTYTNYKS